MAGTIVAMGDGFCDTENSRYSTQYKKHETMNLQAGVGLGGKYRLLWIFSITKSRQDQCVV